MKEHRRCPYCKGTYDDDVTSDKAPILGRKCAHTICVGCLQHLRMEEKRITKRKVVATIKCPECKVSGSFVVTDKPNLAFCQILKDLVLAEEEIKKMMLGQPPKKRAKTDQSSEVIAVDGDCNKEEKEKEVAKAESVEIIAVDEDDDDDDDKKEALKSEAEAKASTLRNPNPNRGPMEEKEKEAAREAKSTARTDDSNLEIIVVDDDEEEETPDIVVVVVEDGAAAKKALKNQDQQQKGDDVRSTRQPATVPPAVAAAEAGARAASTNQEQEKRGKDVGNTTDSGSVPPGVAAAGEEPERARGRVQQREAKKSCQLSKQPTTRIPTVYNRALLQQMLMGSTPTTAFQPSMPMLPPIPTISSLLNQDQKMVWVMLPNQFIAPSISGPTTNLSTPPASSTLGTTAASNLKIVRAEEMEWKRLVNKLKEFKSREGHCNVPLRDGELGSWVATQRLLFKTNQLPTTRIYELISLGFGWEFPVVSPEKPNITERGIMTASGARSLRK